MFTVPPLSSSSRKGILSLQEVGRFYHPQRERELLPTSSQKGLSRVGHERLLNTNSCANQPANKHRVHEPCIEGIKHR